LQKWERVIDPAIPIVLIDWLGLRLALSPFNASSLEPKNAPASSRREVVSGLN